MNGLLGLVAVEPVTEATGPGDSNRPGSGAAARLGVRAVGSGLLQSQATLDGPTPDVGVLVHANDTIGSDGAPPMMLNPVG